MASSPEENNSRLKESRPSNQSELHLPKIGEGAKQTMQHPQNKSGLGTVNHRNLNQIYSQSLNI